jgi:hypothetical protein
MFQYSVLTKTFYDIITIVCSVIVLNYLALIFLLEDLKACIQLSKYDRSVIKWLYSFYLKYLSLIIQVLCTGHI